MTDTPQSPAGQSPASRNTPAQGTSTRLAGKVAIVTGGGQGVGRGISLGLAESGAAVLLVGRKMHKLERVAEEIRAAGGTAECLATDITAEDAPETIISTAVERLGGVDILVNNANMAMPLPLSDYPDDDFRTAFEGGPRVTLSLMKLARPEMAERGGGTVINLVTSAAVRWDAANYGIYAAVKEAVRALTRAAAYEWAADGIRALNVAPHAHSPGLDWWMDNNPEEAAEFIAGIPAGRVGDPVADIGRPVAWLCSAEASYLTGATIPLDGGQSRWG
ncbi:SDR family oxidoreductase [Dietzia cinnamea]|uniref:SDR family NAD(P)-dependent oxidoreductase n=1 Tax=Dietzia TaxID=37914 RepID=UPI0009FFAAB0|nr:MULTISPECIES: SDR family oxidoreductase [Dietzia]AVM63427.1 KR domain-containing protein [Dietzia sp. oral taxon 368]MCT1884656.1 SDR family oxidoreductase [Dietzia cinnamea]MCT2057802.1 SDR family oxidoreductase [Dietzia cinnamea]MCT2098765.1 SDR family oxidoreductase [Dietzia cinnamea]MCT2120514.1 SDR family oxidoreductase [Dietzia cinnamea]